MGRNLLKTYKIIFPYMGYKKYFVAVAVFILFSALAIWCVARFNIKKEPESYPYDVDTKGYLYSYGLGIIKGSNWLGRVKIKAEFLYPSGKLRDEVFYDKDDRICKIVSYHETGKIAMISPLKRDLNRVPTGLLVNDGLTQSFYENGQLKAESGFRIGTTCPVVDHGVKREYSIDSKMISEKFFINNNECTKIEWDNWLKKHPEDIKYSKSDDSRWGGYIIAGIVSLGLVGLITFIWRRRIRARVRRG